MKELGEGFSFIDNEYKIKIGNRYNYIDLLLYNINYYCYVVIELKVTELKKEHIGQIEIYMNYIDKNISKNVRVGVIVSTKKCWQNIINMIILLQKTEVLYGS